MTPYAALVAAGITLAAAAPLPTRPPSPSVVLPPGDTVGADALRSALDRLYDGSTDDALSQLRSLAADHPHDPLAVYFQALALCWKVEQRADSTEHDAELLGLVERVLTMTDPSRGPRREGEARAPAEDARARLARGGAFGVRSRLHLFRLHSREAARAAAAMREELLPLRDRDPVGPEAQFGIGLYEYYVDVLPRAVKILRFLSGLPGGDRKRGLAAIQTAKERSAFHDVEASAQLYEIYAYYENQPDLALAQVRELHERYPGSPLWALKLAEHLRERMGRYADSAAVARDIVIAAEREDENFGPVAGALGRLALGEALLLDLRLSEARRMLLAAREGLPPALAARARLGLGRTLELEGDRDAALAHYRAAALSADPEVRRPAEAAVEHAMGAAEIRAAPGLAEARRLREGGRQREAVSAYREVLRLWSACTEARLRVAEDDIRHGRLLSARPALRALEDEEHPQPPWVRPWSLLLRGYAEDLSGQREAAVIQYKEVLKAPCGDPELVREATRRLRSAFRAELAPEPAVPPADH